MTHPVLRQTLFVGLFLWFGIALVAGFVLGVGAPTAILGALSTGQLLSISVLLTVGSFLAGIFLAISFLLAIIFDDRGKGLAAALAVWLFTALLYDGLVLMAAMSFSEYPLETPLLVASMANPIDLARVTLLIQTDWAALMGYTGAVFSRFFGTSLGVAIATVSLGLWTMAPLWVGLSKFRIKDL